MIKEKIGIIGLGNMGSTLARKLKKGKIVSACNLLLFDIDEHRLNSITQDLESYPADSNQELLSKSQIVILAVKPQDLIKVLKDAEGSWKTAKLIISIAAGVTTTFLEEKIKEKVPVIRAMPNTPGQIGAGITVLSYGRLVKLRHKQIAQNIFRTFGEVIEAKEELMDLITALSGSGPAYFFLIMEALIETGQRLGLEKAAAEKLVKETILGAAKLAKRAGENLSQLREKVTSPGGTTEAALKIFKDADIKKIIFHAVTAAKKRSEKLTETTNCTNLTKRKKEGKGERKNKKGKETNHRNTEERRH